MMQVGSTQNKRKDTEPLSQLETKDMRRLNATWILDQAKDVGGKNLGEIQIQSAGR